MQTACAKHGFCKPSHSLLKKLQVDGMMSDDEAESRIISLVAWAAVGRDILKKPTPEELSQLEQFIDDHTEELHKLLGRRAQAQAQAQ
jgi:hypothetical protein